MVHTPVQTRRLERPVGDESRIVGILDGVVDSIVADGNDCGFSAINRE